MAALLVAAVWLLLTLMVAPILVNKSTAGRNFEWIEPYIREAWVVWLAASLMVAFTLPSVRETVMALHQRINDSTNPLVGYLLAGSLGFALFTGYWWFTGLIASPQSHLPPEAAHGDINLPFAGVQGTVPPPDTPAHTSTGAKAGHLRSASSLKKEPQVADEDNSRPTFQQTNQPGSIGVQGTGNQVTINKKPNPYAMVVYYDFNGVKHTQQGNRFVGEAGEQLSAFPKFGELQGKKDWPELRDITEQQIAKAPEWLTAYIFAGVAHANLGQVDMAIKRLEFVEQNAAGNPDYAEASRLLTQLRSLRR